MPNEQQDSRPSPADVARRLLILKHVVVSAMVAPPRDMLQEMISKWNLDEREKFEKEAEAQRDRFWANLRHAGLWDYLTPREQAHADATVSTLTERQQLDGSWRMEAAQVLMWALRMIPELPPYDTQADPALLKQVPSQDVSAFIASANLRDQDEIDAARDNAEFWHWRSRTRELIERGEPFPDDPQMKAAGLTCYDDIVRMSARGGAEQGGLAGCIDDDFPVLGKAYRDLTDDEWSEVRSITFERHFALNWLCGMAPENDWEQTPTDT